MTDHSLQQEKLEKSTASENMVNSGERLLKRIAPLAVALIMISATVWALAIFGITLYDDYLHIPKEVVVPEATKLEVEEAFKAIEGAGLKIHVYESRHDKKVKKGIVMEQDPQAGKKVRQGRVIRVVVSLGPDLISVPKLTGESLRAAKIAVSNAKLRLGNVDFENAEYGQDEEVVKQNPAAGKDVPRGQEVHLVVRRGW